MLKELDIRGTIAYVNSHPETIKLVESGKIDLKPFITGKIAVEDLIDKGFDTPDQPQRDRCEDSGHHRPGASG